MTQEELDALMSGDMDDIDALEEEVVQEEEQEAEVPQESDEASGKSDVDIKELIGSDIDEGHLPFPATNENKMVHQLDDVTKESEEKASEIFDIIEGISTDLMDQEGVAQTTVETLEANIALFTTLSEKFPDVEAFTTSLEQNKAALEGENTLIEVLQNSGDSIMNVMDIMQYQDIHRQKIERVINVMRALSRYMNTLFEGKIDDDKRVSSAVHIAGDTHNDLASNEDIEALLEQFGS